MVYKLSASLEAHSSDVRALKAPANDIILSASRDTTAICWTRDPSGAAFNPDSVFRPGSAYVNSLAYLPPTSDAPKGYLVTGGQDKLINIFRLGAGADEPEFRLVGHSANVCALDVTAGGAIVSGSWDATAKVWRNFQLAYELKGHESSVLAVLAIDEDKILTASADKTIKLWQQDKVVNTYTGHTDAVRGLALLPDIGFASCSNDTEVRVWTFGGDLLYTLSGHTAFVYSLSVLPNGDIVSSGEDRSARIWKNGECSQVLTHPAISVWVVATMPNGDIVTGASDGVIRVFSEAEDRWASADDIKSYEDTIARQALPSQQVEGLNTSDMPGVEALATPGTRSGQQLLVKNGEVVEAHQWDSLAGQWQKVGDVVGAVGNNKRQLFKGKEYDYVFDVAVQDGAPSMKLPYNANENPYTAAQRFLASNDLPMHHLDEVAQFIQTNTTGVSLGASSEYVDPFTGASSYRAGSGSGSAPAPSGNYVDPFTGASRYQGTPSQPIDDASAYQDPFTGASRYQSAPPPAAAKPKVIPAPAVVTFKQANVNAMQSKLNQFNEALANEISTSALAMYPEELAAVDDAFAVLSQPSPDVSLLGDAQAEAVISILERWPTPQLFPVIDLTRLLAGHCLNLFRSPAQKERLFSALYKAAEWGAPWTPPVPKARETNVLLVLRTAANVFQDGTTLSTEPWLTKLLDGLSATPYTLLNKNQRVVLATVLFNASCVALKSPIDPAVCSKVVSLILQALQAETNDSEASYRTLVALGNLAYARKAQIDPALKESAATLLRGLPTVFGEERVRNACQEIAALLL
ncbi:WD40-repeat-containing domain protein [Schizophyllum amplum]|uniref:WD40-repeat-containing domain protein n=1 Tax=Schizophyllum amplum TaxID=97359 RepID=A0A550C1B1_9AGAR|nr:WD40-repeat-containing domain protein [Auriculariopsis ampla]